MTIQNEGIVSREGAYGAKGVHRRGRSSSSDHTYSIKHLEPSTATVPMRGNSPEFVLLAFIGTGFGRRRRRTGRLPAAGIAGRPRPIIVASGWRRIRGRLMGDTAAMLSVPRPTAGRTLFLGRWGRGRRWSAYGETAHLLAIPRSRCSFQSLVFDAKT